MIVMKFGGTSVESAEAIERVAGIVRARMDRQPLVVVSAMGKTTNKLLAIAAAAVAGERQRALEMLEDLEDFICANRPGSSGYRNRCAFRTVGGAGQGPRGDGGTDAARDRRDFFLRGTHFQPYCDRVFRRLRDRRGTSRFAASDRHGWTPHAGRSAVSRDQCSIERSFRSGRRWS